MVVLLSRDELPPRFVGAPFEFEVSENAPVSASVGVVSATDDDLKEELLFAVIQLPPASLFFDVTQFSPAMCLAARSRLHGERIILS